jgi:hypothetical protein
LRGGLPRRRADLGAADDRRRANTSRPEGDAARQEPEAQGWRDQSIKIKVRELPAIAEGDYRLGVIVDPRTRIPEETKTDNAAADPALHHVGPPVIDLTGVYLSTPPTLEPGVKERVTVEVTNHGKRVGGRDESS